MNVLTLQVVRFSSLTRWRWVLTDVRGAFIADHEVALDPDAPEFEGFLDLPKYLRYRGLPNEMSDEGERVLLLTFGKWLSKEAFGPLAQVIATFAPVTVRVRVPAQAEELLQRPFEATVVNGELLSTANIILAFEVEDDPVTPKKQEIGDALRILAVFSLPPLESPLNLRTERQALRQLVHELRGGGYRANIELRTLQYGTSRETLCDILDYGDGWDIIHFSGHGLPGRLVLESEDGTADVIDADDIARILRGHRHRLKLVMVSACHSGAGDIQMILSTLGIQAEFSDDPSTVASKLGQPVARALAKALDCTVLAMRFPVEDRFAIDLANSLYRQLLMNRATLPLALQRSIKAAAKGDVSCLSAITPTLLGKSAVGLALVPPKAGRRQVVVQDAGAFGFPPEAKHFVGRVSAMTRASAALGVRSVTKGVLFHGMAGAGKSACAIELAHHFRQANRFQAWVWFKAPDRGRDIKTALHDFALTMEIHVPGLSMIEAIDSDEALIRWLPQLREIASNYAILIALDNIESLLTDTGTWRDQRFGRVVAALVEHDGLSRMVMTSQVRPAQLPTTVLVEPIHALTLAEATLLMSRPPRLYRLLNGTRNERDLARRLLGVVQGHPKLIELADGMAADLGVLERQIERAEQAWLTGGNPTSAFFAQGMSAVSDEGFLHALEDWTDGAAANLAEVPLLTFQLLCIAEEDDREDWIVTAVWQLVHSKLPSPSVDAQSIPPAVSPLIAAALIEQIPGVETTRWSIHPSVAARGASTSSPAFVQTATEAFADFWCAVYQTARDQEDSGTGPMIRRAALAAAPYLLRVGRWSIASTLLEQALAQDGSAATASAVLPWLGAIAEATRGSDEELFDRGKYAKALRLAGRWAEAESELQRTLEAAVESRNFRLASAVCGELITLLSATGRLDAALVLAKKKSTYTRRAGLGPWTQMLDVVKRLSIYSMQGKSKQVLRGVAAMQRRFSATPPERHADEAADPRNVREMTFDLGRSATQSLKRWSGALAYNSLTRTSMRERGAGQLETSWVDFNDYMPLLELKRYAEARFKLDRCRSVFEQYREVRGLAAVLSAFASLEHCMRGAKAAREFEMKAIRYHYMVGDPILCALSHFNLANYLMNEDVTRASVSHRIAATTIGLLSGSGMLKDGLDALTTQLVEGGPSVHAILPMSLDALSSTVGQVDGVHFVKLISSINSHGADLDSVVVAVVRRSLEFVAEYHTKAAGGLSR